jgi:glycosyltransferase involved in cell wall biosynthesis
MPPQSLEEKPVILDPPSPTRKGPEITVVTPYHKESLEWLRRCHESVMGQQVEANVTHIMVADGHPRPEIDQWNVTHIRLPNEHGDNGNTPRAVGSVVAQTNGAEFIAFLDADNWYYPDHLASMLEGHRQTGASVMCAWRDFYTPEGRKLDLTEGIEGNLTHVDTSGLMLHRPVFDLNTMWVAIPRTLSPWCDRIFFIGILHRRHMLCFTRRRSVAFTTVYLNHYAALGLAAPASGKVPPEAEMAAYLHSAEGIREMAARMGFWPTVTPG